MKPPLQYERNLVVLKLGICIEKSRAEHIRSESNNLSFPFSVEMQCQTTSFGCTNVSAVEGLLETSVLSARK